MYPRCGQGRLRLSHEPDVEVALTVNMTVQVEDYISSCWCMTDFDDLYENAKLASLSIRLAIIIPLPHTAANYFLPFSSSLSSLASSSVLHILQSIVALETHQAD